VCRVHCSQYESFPQRLSLLGLRPNALSLTLGGVFFPQAWVRLHARAAFICMALNKRAFICMALYTLVSFSLHVRGGCFVFSLRARCMLRDGCFFLRTRNILRFALRARWLRVCVLHLIHASVCSTHALAPCLRVALAFFLSARAGITPLFKHP
jgi:hypothetical protein